VTVDWDEPVELFPPIGEIEGPIDIEIPSCCDPVPCGFPVGTRVFKMMTDDWDEERRGWSGL